MNLILILKIKFMKKVFTASFLLLLTNFLFAQIQNPVSWTATSKKIADKTYEIHLTATIHEGWHVYSQTTPEGGPVPTSISFTKNPLLDLNGTAKEIGKRWSRGMSLYLV